EGGSSIYPVGEAPLKDIVTDYASLTGSNKWLLASIMLLVFRPVLHSAASLEKYVLAHECAELKEKFGT
ncbi:unnamed protein product, partial [Ectocarpus sp. 4 AP-2014]